MYACSSLRRDVSAVKQMIVKSAFHSSGVLQDSNEQQTSAYFAR